jgi:hypothetical protein
VPLASFASDVTINNKKICKVYVQYLPAADETSTYDMSIVLGTMFFQSFSMYVSEASTSEVQVTFNVNTNALSSAYLGSAVATEGSNAFPITPMELIVT